MPAEPALLPEAVAAPTVVDTAPPGSEAAVASRRRRRITIGVILAMIWIAVIVLLAIAAPWLPIRAYDEPDFAHSKLPPFHDWSVSNVLGTDKLGRSLLSRVIYGARVSLAVGFVSVGIGMVVGTLLGMVAGYLKGAADRTLSVVADAMIAFPPLVLLLALVTIFDRSLRNIILRLS